MGALEVAAGSSEVVLVVEHDAQGCQDAVHPVVVVTVHGLKDNQGALQVGAGTSEGHLAVGHTHKALQDKVLDIDGL
jgi:hypothetical protein